MRDDLSTFKRPHKSGRQHAAKRNQFFLVSLLLAMLLFHVKLMLH